MFAAHVVVAAAAAASREVALLVRVLMRSLFKEVFLI